MHARRDRPRPDTISQCAMQVRGQCLGNPLEHGCLRGMAPRARLDFAHERVPMLLVRDGAAVGAANTRGRNDGVARHNTRWVLIGALGANQAGFVNVRPTLLARACGQRLLHLLVHGYRQHPVTNLPHKMRTTGVKSVARSGCERGKNTSIKHTSSRFDSGTNCSVGSGKSAGDGMSVSTVEQGRRYAHAHRKMSRNCVNWSNANKSDWRTNKVRVVNHSGITRVNCFRNIQETVQEHEAH